MALLGQHDGLMTQPDPFLREGFGQSLKFFEAVMVLDKHRSSSWCDSDAQSILPNRHNPWNRSRKFSGLGISPMPRPTTRLDAIAATLLFVALAAPARAQPPGPREAGKPPENGRQWALLIGVEKYQKELPLAFTVNDVTILAKTLRERNGFGADEVLTMTDDAEPANLRPTRANLIEEIPRWLARIGAATG